jgi:intracellular multiplication protein IcmL
MAALDFFKQEQQDNAFYRLYQPRFIIVLMGATVVAMVWAGIVVFQVYHRPLPSFYAVQPNGQRMMLQPQDLPNLTAATILRFASKAAVAGYTFDFVNYKRQIGAARPYFTTAGWNNYLTSVAGVVRGIATNKLFVTGVVNGPPVISNQGDLNGTYSWRVQIPFLVTYQSAQSAEQSKYTVLITVVRIPTTTDPLGIGIDQFVMS